LEEHLRVDHHADPSQFERFHYKPMERRPAGKRYVVIANQTLSDDSLLQRLQSLGREGAHLHLVVPATPADPSSEHTDDKGLALATYRVRHAVDRLHESGVDAEGEVGPADPVKAVAAALQHEPADELILATLPVGMSRWLQVDVPTALQRRFGLPVTVITATHGAP
jgi:hypothetical protein